MPYKLQSLAKIILVCSLLTGLASAYFGQQWTRNTATVKASLVKVKKDSDQAKAALDAIETKLAEGSPATSLETLIPDLMLDVFNQRTAYGISLAVAAPAKTGSAQMPQVRALAEPIPGSTLKSLSISLSGTYKSYSELLAYLGQLTLRPVAISHLKVHEQSFEVTLRAFGTVSEK